MILLISETPVAGTVPRLAYWIHKLSGIECHALIKRNYAHNAFHLPEGTFGCLPDWEHSLVKCIRRAHTLIIHNVCDEGLMNLIFQAKSPSACVIYQYHSPPHEPPQFDYPVIKNFSFDALFAVAQGYSRFLDCSIPVPNIIPDFNSVLEVSKSKTIFAPHMRSTLYRWSSKFTERDREKLDSAQNCFSGFRVANFKKVFGRETVTHDEILMFLQSVSVVVDDINTGLFHQTAIEALKAGCLTFSGADLYAIEDFCVAAEVDPPPFVQVTGIEDLVGKMTNPLFGKIVEQGMLASHSYAEKFLGEERLAQRYFNILKKHAPHLS